MAGNAHTVDGSAAVAVTGRAVSMIKASSPNSTPGPTITTDGSFARPAVVSSWKDPSWIT
jgi:hypothetical protein